MDSKLRSPNNSSFFFEHDADYTGCRAFWYAKSVFVDSKRFHFIWEVSIMLFNCVHVVSISSLTINSCFFSESVSRCLSTFLIPTRCTIQFPRVLWLNGEFRFALATAKFAFPKNPYRDDENTRAFARRFPRWERGGWRGKWWTPNITWQIK